MLLVSKTFHHILTRVVQVEGKSMQNVLWDIQRDKILVLMKATSQYSDKDADAVHEMLPAIINSPHIFEMAEFIFWRRQYFFPDRPDRPDWVRRLARLHLEQFFVRLSVDSRCWRKRSEKRAEESVNQRGPTEAIFVVDDLHLPLVWGDTLTLTEALPSTNTIWKIGFKIGLYYIGSFKEYRSHGCDSWRGVSLEPFANENGDGERDIAGYLPRWWLWYKMQYVKLNAYESKYALVEYKLVDCQEGKLVNPAKVEGLHEGADWKIEQIQV
jgi:hypothetical protein